MSKRTRLIGITLALAAFTASAAPLWPTHEAKSLAKPEKGQLTEDGKSEKQILEERAVLRANMAANAPTQKFSAGEFQAFIAGSATLPELRSLDDFEDHIAGFSLGANYFFTRNLGLGFEARHILDDDEDFLNHMLVNGIFRLPMLSDNIAPYAIFGVGYRYQDHDVDFRAAYGLGAEWRLSPQWGLFADWRVLTENFKSFDEGGYVVRTGLTWSWGGK